MRKKVGAIITLVIVALLFLTLKDIQFKEIYSALAQIEPIYILLALASYLIYYFLWTIRLKNTLGNYIKPKFFYLIRTIFAGTFVNTITPGVGVGGEPIRAYYMGKKYKKPSTKILGLIAADQIFNVIGIALYIAVSVILAFLLIDATIIKSTIFLVLAITIIASIVLFHINWKNAHKEIHWIEKQLYHLKAIKKHFPNLPQFESYLTHKIHNSTSVLKKAVTNKQKIQFGVAISIIYRALEYLAAYFIFLALGHDISLGALIIVVTFAHLLGDVSPIPGGIGLVESAMIVLYSTLGVPIHIATVSALIIRAIYYIYTLAIGGLSLLSLQKEK